MQSSRHFFQAYRGGDRNVGPESAGAPARRRSGGLRIVLATLLLVLAGLVAPGRAAAQYPFPDVPTSYAYRLQIEVLADVGVVSGMGGVFAPEHTLTRQQFAKMVVLAMRLPVSEADVSPFGDVEISGPGGLYPDNYVAAAAREGIVKGTRAGTATSRPLFSPYQAVTAAQMVTMATRAAGRPLASPPSTYQSVWGEFDPGHGPTARIAQYNGLLRELPLAAMDPWAPATRGQAAALLYNLIGTDPPGMAGRFLGTSGDLVTFFKSRSNNRPVGITLEALAKLYASYGRRFGIRADLAWAQMIHETGFLGYGGDVQPQQYNYAGIGATGGVPGNSFATPELGVVAHYAHLAWYLYPVHLDDESCRLVAVNPTTGKVEVPGDPRHFVTPSGVHKGTVRTVFDLGGQWAVPGTGYGQAILTYAAAIPVTKGW